MSKTLIVTINKITNENYLLGQANCLFMCLDWNIGKYGIGIDVQLISLQTAFKYFNTDLRQINSFSLGYWNICEWCVRVSKRKKISSKIKREKNIEKRREKKKTK